MGLLQLGKWLKYSFIGMKKPTNHTFTKEDFEKAEMAKSLKSLQKQIMDDKYLLLKKLVNQKDKPNMQDVLIKLMLNKGLQSPKNEFGYDQPYTPAPQQQVVLTDEQIKGLFQANPKRLKMCKVATDEQIKEGIMGEMPTVSKDTIDRVIQYVRTQ